MTTQYLLLTIIQYYKHNDRCRNKNVQIISKRIRNKFYNITCWTLFGQSSAQKTEYTKLYI